MIQDILKILSNTRFTLSTEKILQSEIYEILHPLYPSTEPEKRLDGKNIIDFLLHDIGIEVKIRGSKKAIYKQCVRYCGFSSIKSLILVTNVTMGMPKEINGKDCYMIKLGNAWL